MVMAWPHPLAPSPFRWRGGSWGSGLGLAGRFGRGPVGAAEHPEALLLLGEVRQAGVLGTGRDLQEIFAQRPAGEALPQEDAAQVRVAREANTEEVVDLALLQLRPVPDRDDGGDLRLIALVDAALEHGQVVLR